MATSSHCWEEKKKKVQTELSGVQTEVRHFRNCLFCHMGVFGWSSRRPFCVEMMLKIHSEVSLRIFQLWTEISLHSPVAPVAVWPCPRSRFQCSSECFSVNKLNVPAEPHNSSFHHVHGRLLLSLSFYATCVTPDGFYSQEDFIWYLWEDVFNVLYLYICVKEKKFVFSTRWIQTETFLLIE